MWSVLCDVLPMEPTTTYNYVPNNIGRKVDGTFLPGTVPNPHGRGAGVLNKAKPFIDGTITPENIAALEGLSKRDLIDLIKKVSGAVWGYALMSDEERLEAARLKFYHMGMSASEVHKSLPALKEWFDRTVGKAPQSMTMTVKQDPLAKAKDDDIVKLLAMMSEPLLIAPMPKTLDHED